MELAVALTCSNISPKLQHFDQISRQKWLRKLGSINGNTIIRILRYMYIHMCGKRYLKKIFQACKGDIKAIEESIHQEKDEKLVVVEGHTIVHPRTVVVHLQTKVL